MAADADAKPVENVELDQDQDIDKHITDDKHATDAMSPDTLSVEQLSVYGLWSTRQRYTVLLVAAFATLLLPFSDTIYLPALESIQKDLNTTRALVTASVSVYLVAVGVVCLLWGPLSDKFGRRWTYIGSAAAFIALSIVCVFAPSIEVLVVFRVLQGAVVGAFWAVGQGAIADIFPPEQRGTASGLFMIPVLIGPILGPLVGGGLSQAFGWRSTFICLAAMGGVALLGMFFLLPETHPWFTLAKLEKKEPKLARSISIASSINKPVFMAPWGPLQLLATADIAPHAVVTLIFFGSMFVSITELPLFLAAPPYNMSEGMIGVSFLPSGIGSFIGSIIGGMLSDKTSTKFPASIEARLLPGLVLSVLLGVPAFVLYGWSLSLTWHLAAVMAAHFFVGFAPAVYLPCIFSFLTLKNQAQASAAAAGLQSLMFIMSGVLISVAAVVVEAIGAGPVFTIAAGLCLVTGVVSLLLVVMAVRRGLAGSTDQVVEVTDVSGKV